MLIANTSDMLEMELSAYFRRCSFTSVLRSGYHWFFATRKSDQKLCFTQYIVFQGNQSFEPVLCQRWIEWIYLNSIALADDSVTLAGFGCFDGMPAVVWEVPESGWNTMYGYLRETPLAQQVNLMQQLAKFYANAHEKNIAIRYLSPSQILVTPGRLLTYGLSQATSINDLDAERRRLPQPFYVLNEYEYWSPEMLSRHVDDWIHSDIYVFATMAYEMLTGLRPFEGDVYSIPTRMKHSRFIPIQDIRKDCPKTLSVAIEQCLSADPARRPNAMREVLAMIETAVKNMTFVHKHKETMRSRSKNWLLKLARIPLFTRQQRDSRRIAK